MATTEKHKLSELNAALDREKERNRLATEGQREQTTEERDALRSAMDRAGAAGEVYAANMKRVEEATQSETPETNEFVKSLEADRIRLRAVINDCEEVITKIDAALK